MYFSYFVSFYSLLFCYLLLFSSLTIFYNLSSYEFCGSFDAPYYWLAFALILWIGCIFWSKDSARILCNIDWFWICGNRFLLVLGYTYWFCLSNLKWSKSLGDLYTLVRFIGISLIKSLLFLGEDMRYRVARMRPLYYPTLVFYISIWGMIIGYSKRTCAGWLPVCIIGLRMRTSVIFWLSCNILYLKSLTFS